LSRVRRDALILVLVVILLGVFAYFAFPLSKTNLGLDLQGGLAVILEAPEGTAGDKVDQALKIIQDRVNRLGVAEPEIQKQGDLKISVQLPGIDNPEEALATIGKTAVLEFHEVSTFGTPYASEAEALKAANVSTRDELAKLDGYHAIIRWGTAGGNSSEQWFLVTTAPKLTGAMLKSAALGYETNSNKPKVDMQFTDEGATLFGELTKKLADAAAISGENQLLAIVLDDEVESAPRVLEEISGGRAEITGKYTLSEAKALVLVLQTGALPVELTPVSQNTVGATLGKAALNQALLAGFIGLILIMVFMIAYYRLLGVVASVALIIYGVLFIGVLNAIGVTMTLPGIAGMILTLGMAVDANVLIFARMRDEVGAGKTVMAATSAGFKKAFRAVFDCNMTTIITAVILFFAASGGVKGFALTLGVGVALSLFTAVLVTRSMLSLLSGWRPFRNLKLLGLHVPKSHTAPINEGSKP
jgi:preprotein translocase subunit SecD